MLVVGLCKCSFHGYKVDRNWRRNWLWLPKKASNTFEAFEVGLMEL